MASAVTKAVIPAAGLGTRFLPATKAMPKEMLPVVDKPAIQYVVEEAVAAGLTDVLMITGRNKNALENHFDRNYELESALEAKGDASRLREVMHSAELADVHYLRQGDALGLGHAILKSRQHVGQEPFAVLLGDNIFEGQDALLRRLIEVHEATGASIVALEEVPASEVHKYGVATIEPFGDESDLVRINGLVEKPEPGTEPSRLVISGRYILTPAIYDTLEATEPGRGGEIQLTDALQRHAEEGIGGGVVGVVWPGRRYDTGDKLEYLKAIVEIAVQRDDLGPELRAWLKEFTAEL